MNVWTVILLVIVIVSITLYFLVAIVGLKTRKIFGTPLAITIIAVLLVGLSYYLVWEKSVYVVITVDENVLQKRAIKFSDDVLNKNDIFIYSSVTRGIPVIDYKQQVKDFLTNDKVMLCRDYKSQATGEGRYRKEAGKVSICINKKGVRWYF